jgi:hypothetical protein
VTFTYTYTNLEGNVVTGHSASINSQANGEAEFSFTIPVATTATVTAELTGILGAVPAAGGGTSVQFEFKPGPVDPTRTVASFQVGKDTVRADGVATVPAQMKVQDAQGNGIGGLECSFDVTNPPAGGAVFPGDLTSISGIISEPAPSGICRTTLTSLYGGAFPVTGTFQTETSGSQNANYTNQAIHTFNSFWSVAPTTGNVYTPARADAIDSYTVTINLRDVDDIPINAMSVNIQWKLSTETEWGAPVAVTSAAPNGIATGTIKTTVAGTYDVRVVAGADIISTNAHSNVELTQQIVFAPGDPDPTRTATTWVASTGKVLNDGTATHSGTITVLDINNNKVPNAVIDFALSNDKDAHFTSTATSGGTLGKTISPASSAVEGPDYGVIRVYVATTTAETTQITATLATVTVGTAPFEFGPGGPSVTTSTFVITPAYPETRIANGTASFTGVVTVRDAASVPVGGYAVSFDKPDDVTILETAPYLTDQTTGQVTVHFVSTKANAAAPNDFYTVNALIGTEKIPAADHTTVDQKIKFVAGPVDLTASTFDVTTSTRSANGTDSHSGTAHVTDAAGNAKEGETVSFSIATGAADVAGPVLKVGAGTASTVVTGVTDALGNVTVVITSNEPGTFLAVATVGGNPILGFADTVNRNRSAQFVSGTPDPAHSGRTINPNTDVTATASVAADGNESFAITVTVRSSEDIRVENASVRIFDLDSSVVLAEGNGIQLTGLPVPTPSNTSPYGQFIWHAKSTVADSTTARVQVRIGADWFDIGSPIKLNFTATKPVPDKSWLVEPVHTTDPATSTTAVANNTATLPVSAYVFDANDNAVLTGTVIFTIPEGTSVGTTTAASGSATVSAEISNTGVATILVRSAIANTYEITATVGSDLPNQILSVKQAPGRSAPEVHSDGNAHVTFVYGDPDPTQSVLTIPTAVGGATKVANNVEKHRAEVAVKDATGNAVKSGTVTFHYTYIDNAGNTQNGDSGAITVNSTTGIATWDFGSLVAKPWTITATLSGAIGNVTPVAGLVANFVPGPIDPTATVNSLQVGPTAKADGTAVVAAWMIVQDANTNPVAGGLCGFQVFADPLEPDGQAKIGNADNGDTTKLNVGPTANDGKCEVQIRSIYSGAFPVQGIYGTARTASPLPTANFNNQAVDPAKSYWSVAPASGNTTTPATANDADAYIVTVNLRDAADAIVNNESVDVYYKLTPNGTEHLLTVTSGAGGNTPGTAKASIHTTVAGIYDVYVKKGSDLISTTVGGSVTTEQVEFRPGVPSATQSFLTSASGTAKANGVAVLTVTATVKDANGNLIGNVPVVFALPPDVKSGASTTSITINTGASGDAKGVASLPLTSTKPGTYNITAVAGGVSIVTGSPATATFVNDDLSLTNSTLVLTSTPAAKQVRTETHTVTATLFDAQGSVFTPQREITFYAQEPGASTWTLLGTATTVNGVAVQVVNAAPSYKAGVWHVRAQVTSDAPQGPIGTAPDGTIVDAEFKAGPADPTRTQTTWTGSTGTVLSNNTATHFAQVTVVDQDGNPTSGSVVFSLSADKDAHFTTALGGGKGPLSLGTSTTSSVLRAEFASPSTVDETTTITATLSSVSVVGTPSTFDFGPGAPDPDNSTFVITPAYPTTRIADGAEYFTGVVTVRSAAATPLPVSGYTVSFDLPADVRIVGTPSLVTDPAGQVTVNFVSTKANAPAPNDFYTVNALMGSAKVPAADGVTFDQKIKFVAGPISFDNSKTFLTVVTNNAEANGTATNTVTATLRDTNDNPVRGIDGGQVTFVLPSSDISAVGPLVVSTDNNGVATLNVTSEKADTVFNITATARQSTAAGWTQITGGSPAAVTFVPGAVVAGSSELVVSTGTRTANGTATHDASVQLRDAKGNAVKTAGQTVQFVFSLTGQPSVSVNALTDANGLASTPYATTKAGAWSVAATYGSDPVKDSPQTITFVAGIVSPSVSTFDVTGGKIQADGLAEHRAWAVVTDADRNPIGGVVVEFTINAGAASVPGPVLGTAAGTPGTLVTVTATSDPATGVAEVFVTSEEPGTFPVTAKIGTTTIGSYAVTPNNRDAQFASGDPDPANSFRNITPNTDPAPAGDPNIAIKADSLEQYAITVTIKSAFGTKVENAAVRLVLPSGTPVTLVEGSGSDGSLITGLPIPTPTNASEYGTFTWHAKSSTAGTYTGQVQVRVGATWYDVGLPVKLNFEAGPPAAQCDAGVTRPCTNFAFVPLDLNTSDTSTGTVLVTDRFGNPIAGASVTFTKSGGGFFVPSTGVVTTGSDGTATIGLTEDPARGDDVYVDVEAQVAGLSIRVNGRGTVTSPVFIENIHFNHLADTTPPDAPFVNPTNGTEVSGTAEPESIITVTDEAGDEVPGCEAVLVGTDGKFVCTPTNPIADGETITVIATDPSGNASAPTTVTVGAIGAVLSPAKLYRGDTMLLRGYNFTPSEKVSVVCNSVAYDLGTFTAGLNGQVIVPNWDIPADFDFGQHICTFTGEKSGPVSVPFQVLEPVVVYTGGSVGVPVRPITDVAPGSGFAAAYLPKRKLA